MMEEGTGLSHVQGSSALEVSQRYSIHPPYCECSSASKMVAFIGGRHLQLKEKL